MINIRKAQEKMKNIDFIFLISSIHTYNVLHVLIKYTSQSLLWTPSPSSQYFPFKFLCLFLKSLSSLYTAYMHMALGSIKHGCHVKGSIAERNLTLLPAVINNHLRGASWGPPFLVWDIWLLYLVQVFYIYIHKIK